VALFHIVGLTPEAATLDEAFQGKKPEQTFVITMKELRQSWEMMTTSKGKSLQMVVLGSPHFSLEEFKQLAPLVIGRHCHPDVQFLITSSRAMTLLADRAGFIETLHKFGAKITVDTCILTTPMLPNEIKVLMTNSAKYAYYSPGMLNTQVIFGSLKDCVESAIAGRVIRDESLWERQIS